MIEQNTPEVASAARPAKAPSGYARRLAWLQERMDRWWYLPCVAGLAGLDNFILCFPTDVFLVSTAALRPQRWVRIFLAFATGSALGMLALSWAVSAGGSTVHDLLSWLLPKDLDLSETGGAAHTYGAWALFIVAINPLVPSQPAVILATVAGMKPLSVFVWVYLGRLTKYGAYTFAAARAPRLVARYLRSTPKEPST